MRITMIGHASIFVETEDCNILMDPVLFDPHAEGIADICPEREVIHDQIPEFDVLIISHKHIDHFDIRSLASLSKNVDVFIPKDKILQNSLRELGYFNIYPLGDFDEVKIGSTTLLTTRSEYRVPEFGILVADPSGVFWNQVDSEVNLDTIRSVKSRYPQIDFLLAPWQPMLELNYQNNSSLSFPYVEYNRVLETINLIQPKAIAPGANGFKFIAGSSFLNQIVFPVTREQFCRDIKIICPEIKDNVFALDPGDVLTINKDKFSKSEGNCLFINKLEESREGLDFSPVNIGNNLIDDNPDNYDIDDMRKAIEEEVCLNLPRLIMEQKDSTFIEHFRWQITYQLEIIFPDYICKWHFDFSGNNIQAYQGRNPLANLVTVITASSFYGFIKRIKSWDYVHIGGYYRSFEKIYLATMHGIIKPEKPGNMQDPIELMFPYNELFQQVRQQEIEMWKQPTEDLPISNKRETFMMKTGNTFVRLAKKSNNRKIEKRESTESLELIHSS